ncbi:hypothetical protein D0Y65_009908, partial [Glycine soja]
RSWYGIVSDILDKSGFNWDGTKHMITVENENVWNEYCIGNRVTGHGAETAMDADEATSRETNEVKFMGHTFSSEKDWRKEKE